MEDDVQIDLSIVLQKKKIDSILCEILFSTKLKN